MRLMKHCHAEIVTMVAGVKGEWRPFDAVCGLEPVAI
jgi:hypothetical protein